MTKSIGSIFTNNVSEKTKRDLSDIGYTIFGIICGMGFMYMYVSIKLGQMGFMGLLTLIRLGWA